MDVISMHQAGFTNAVAALGTAFTEGHGMLLKRYTNEVILSFDSDEAGQRAILRAIPILKGAGLTVRVLNLTPYKDPDEFIKELGSEELRNRIQKARSSFMFQVSVAAGKYNQDELLRSRVQGIFYGCEGTERSGGVLRHQRICSGETKGTGTKTGGS